MFFCIRDTQCYNSQQITHINHPLRQVVDRCALTRMSWSPDGRRLCVGDAKVRRTYFCRLWPWSWPLELLFYSCSPRVHYIGQLCIVLATVVCCWFSSCRWDRHEVLYRYNTRFPGCFQRTRYLYRFSTGFSSMKAFHPNPQCPLRSVQAAGTPPP